MRLFAKTFLWVSIILVLCLALNTLIIVQRHASTLEQELIKRNLSLAKSVAYNIEFGYSALMWNFIERMVNEINKTEGTIYLRVVKPDGSVYLGENIDVWKQKMTDKEVGSKNPVTKDTYIGNEKAKIFIEPLKIEEKGKNWTIWLAVSLKSVIEEKKKVISGGAIWMLVFLLLGGAGSWFFSKGITKSIRILTEEMGIIGKGNLDHKIKISSKDEIGDLAKSFNKMAEDLQKTTVSRDSLVKEVSERKRAEEEIKNYQKKIESIINSSIDLIFLKDENFRYIVANKAHEKFFNIKIEDIIGKTDFDFMPEEMAKCCRETDKKALKSGLVSTEELIGEKCFHVVKQKVVDENGKIIGIAAIIRDTTDRKKAEERQRQLMKDLEETNKIMVGRELKMVELKKEVNRLSRELNRPEPYEMSSL